MSETPKLNGLVGAFYQEHDDGTITPILTPAPPGTVYRNPHHQPTVLSGGTNFTYDQQGGA